MAKAKTAAAKVDKKPDSSKLAIIEVKRQCDEQVERQKVAYEEALEDRLEQVEDLGKQVDSLKRALGLKASAVTGKEIYSVTILSAGVHLATYLGVATDPPAAQAAAQALAQAKLAEAPVVGECNVVGRLDFA